LGPWPGAAEGAISLTFDDGMGSQLRVAVPLLERHGLRGTFYLNPRGDDWAVRLEPWRRVAQAGHELGNHTVAHPCSRGFDFVPPGRALEDLTLEAIAADIDLAEERLQALAGAQPRSFAYPCYQDWVGEGAGRRSYVPVVAARYPAARARGERANDPRRCDLHYLWSFPAERLSGAELVGLCEQAAADGRWAVLTFHGVHEGGLSVAEPDLAQLCAHLARHRQRLWTAPLVEVAGAVAAWRAAGAPR
jgi:peptidoglycan/xylan/chitin deacetylase (PgdA/CDA1 family)